MLFRTLSISAMLVLSNGFAVWQPSRLVKMQTQLNLAKKTVTQNKGFQQYGEIDSNYCNLSKDQILDLIRSRNKARRSRNFRKADELLETLNQNNVHLTDTKKLWRADGEIFDINGYSEQEYSKASNSLPITEREEDYVNQKLRDRSKAKLKRDFDTADDIIDELRFLKNVVVDDSALSWRVTEGFKTEYTYGGRRLNNLSEEDIKKIEVLIKQRSDAKGSKNYDLADELLENLEMVHGVRVDDATKSWYFLPKIHDENELMDRPRVSDPRWGESPKESAPENKNESDWSEVDDNVPDGISISDNSDRMPDGISITSDDKPVVPEGISISNESPVPTMPEGVVIESASDHQVPDGISISSDPVPKQPSLSKAALSDFTVPILKDKLRDAGLPVSGRKSELIDRLLNAS